VRPRGAFLKLQDHATGYMGFVREARLGPVKSGATHPAGDGIEIETPHDRKPTPQIGAKEEPDREAGLPFRLPRFIPACAGNTRQKAAVC
jgi:hypothetical protein